MGRLSQKAGGTSEPKWDWKAASSGGSAEKKCLYLQCFTAWRSRQRKASLIFSRDPPERMRRVGTEANRGLANTGFCDDRVQYHSHAAPRHHRRQPVCHRWYRWYRQNGTSYSLYIFLLIPFLKTSIRKRDLPVPPVPLAFDPYKTRVKVSQAN
jgi:hypothetical protein